MFIKDRCEVIMVKKGFSLPEVLISIGIIGILAIVLIPLLTKDNPSKNKVIFRKSYNTLAQIILNMINDDVNYPAAQFDDNGVPKGFNYTTSTESNNKFCTLIANQLNTVGAANCPLDTVPAAAANIATTPIFTMPDGSAWYIRLGGNDSEAATGDEAQFPTPATSPAPSSFYATNIIVDIDGPYKGTNCSADNNFSDNYLPTVTPTETPSYHKCVGVSNPCDQNPDTFILGVRYDGKIFTGTTTNNGDACAIDILKNPTSNTK